MGEGRSPFVRLFSDVASRVQDPFLSRAVTLAERGRGSTAPNPVVGCVIVTDGRIVGEGFHPRAGDPHAEVFALREAGPDARGADVYVTLEPCSHFGKTPPCADALIAAGLARVIIGMRDPNPGSADGAKRLRAAGIRVEFARDPEPFMALVEGWLKRIAVGIPFVTAKLALSLDAHGAFRAGERAAITGASGAAVTRLLRSAADAVLVSASTVIADDPALTVRRRRWPTRCLGSRFESSSCDSRLPPPDAAVFTDGLAETKVLVVGSGATGRGRVVRRRRGAHGRAAPASATRCGSSAIWVSTRCCSNPALGCSPPRGKPGCSTSWSRSLSADVRELTRRRCSPGFLTGAATPSSAACARTKRVSFQTCLSPRGGLSSRRDE